MNCDYVRIFLFKFFVSKSSRHRAPAAFQRSHLISDWNTTGTETSRAPTTAPTRQSDLCLFLFWAVLALVKNSCSVLLFFFFFPPTENFYHQKIRSFLSVGSLEEVHPCFYLSLFGHCSSPSSSFSQKLLSVPLLELNTGWSACVKTYITTLKFQTAFSCATTFSAATATIYNCLRPLPA